MFLLSDHVSATHVSRVPILTDTPHPLKVFKINRVIGINISQRGKRATHLATNWLYNINSPQTPSICQLCPVDGDCLMD